MVRAWPLEQLLIVVWSALRGLLTSPVVGGGHEPALAPLLVLLLIGDVGGAFASVLIQLCLAFEAVEICPDRLLARGVAGGDVEELLGGSQALTSQLVNQGLTGGPRPKSSYNVGVGDIRYLLALLREAPNVPAEGFFGLLSAVFEVPWVPRARVGALEVTHKDLLQVRPIVDAIGRKVL